MKPRETRKGANIHSAVETTPKDLILKLESLTPNERKHKARVYIMHDGTIRHGIVGEDHRFLQLTNIDFVATEHVTDDVI